MRKKLKNKNLKLKSNIVIKSNKVRYKKIKSRNKAWKMIKKKKNIFIILKNIKLLISIFTKKIFSLI
jgi:hypothetical protein